jgi:3D (Asp-Asp-Asp) domain-containing protein
MKLRALFDWSIPFIISLLVIASVPVHAAETSPSSDMAERAFALAKPSLRSLQPIRLWATYYYLYEARTAADGVRFTDQSGRPLSDPVDPRDWCLAAVQGTVRAPWHGSMVTLNLTATGQTAKLDCSTVIGEIFKGTWVQDLGRSYFARATGSFGDGVRNYRLAPFRSIAVDPSAIPFGTVIYVPQARGVEIELAPGVRVRHDGYFFAADEGLNIKGRHIDVYCGAQATNCFPQFINNGNPIEIDAYIVRDERIAELLQRAHRKRPPRRYD